MIKKQIILYLLLSVIFCGCFARGGDLDSTIVLNTATGITAGKANLKGRISSDSSAIFSFVTPFITPVKDALVEIEETGNRTSTDSTGAFEFININPGIYTIKSYRHINNNTLYLGKMTVSVEIGENTLSKEIYLDKPGGLKGFLSVGLADLKDLSIFVEPGSEVYNFSSDKSFFADRLVTGTYSVRIHRKGYKPLEMGEYNVPSGSIIQIPSIPLPFISESGIKRTLSVILKDVNNSSLTGAKIVLENTGEWLWTNDSGVGIFKEITGENIKLRIELQGYENYDNSFVLNSIENEKIVVLNRTRIYTDPKLILNVIDENGNPVNGALIRPYPELEIAYTDFNGCGIINTISGTTQVSIEKPGYATNSKLVYVLTGMNVTGEVILQSENLIENYVLSGTVYNETIQLNQPNAIVRDEQTGLSKLTDSNGNFQLILPKGYHKITVEYSTVFKGEHEIVLNANLSGQIINISN